jgi:hypothetical protein
VGSRNGSHPSSHEDRFFVNARRAPSAASCKARNEI